jgi:probable DNA metabolism protein
MALHTITLAGETDSSGFRAAARSLLSALVAPDEVSWVIERKPTTDHRFSSAGDAAAARACAPAGITHPLVPRSFMSLCETVILHSAPQRFGLLYRLLWRLIHEPGLQRNPLDADRVQALHMAQAVRRDIQKMKALIHFSVFNEAPGSEALHLAWFDPDHHIVEAVAPFFVRRLAPLRWAILTPELSVRWDGHLLEFGPGTPRAATLDGYRGIFGAPPARTAFRNGRDSEAARSSRPDSAS